MSEWQGVTLGDVCTLRAGNVFKTAEQGATHGDLPFIKVSDMNLAGNWSRIQESNNWVTRAQAERMKLKPFGAGTAVFAKIGEGLKQNRIRLLTRDTVIDNNMMGAMPRPGVIDPTYFYYLMDTIDIAATATGTALPYLTVSTLNRVAVRVPDMATQMAVGGVLESIDDLVENNRRRVGALEGIARAIYREWFVRFRYPGHEEVPLVSSSVGPIPEGWELGRVDSLMLLQRGFDLPQQQREPGPIPIIGASGVQGRHSRAKSGGPGVTTGRSGTVGVVTYVPGEFWPLNTALWVKEFRLATPRFAFFLLSELDLKQVSSGAAVPTLDRKVVHALPTVCPPANLIERWDSQVVPMFQMAQALRAHSERLVAIRGLLLPKLVAGQIDVTALDLDALAEDEVA